MVKIEGPGAVTNHLKQSCCFLGVKLQSPLFSTNGNLGPSHFDRISGPPGSAKVEALFPADGHFLLAPEAGRPWFQPSSGDDVPLIHGYRGGSEPNGGNEGLAKPRGCFDVGTRGFIMIYRVTFIPKSSCRI